MLKKKDDPRNGKSVNGLIHEEALTDALLSFVNGGYWGDARGGWLDPVLVQTARKEEMDYVRRHKVYERAPRSECFARTGRPPVKTGWADTNKGTEQAPNIRSR